MGSERLNGWSGWQVWDTSNQEALGFGLRHMSYPDTDIFLLAYDMTRKSTLENLVSHDLNDMKSYELPDPDGDDFDVGLGGWMSELTAGCESDFQIILVGTNADLWEQLNQRGTASQRAQLTTWQEGYVVSFHLH